MKQLLFLLLLPFSLNAFAASFESVLTTLDEGAITSSAQDFMQHVNWIDEPTEAHYTCKQPGGRGDLELWQGARTYSMTKQGEDELRYGENGSVRVFAVITRSEDGKANIFASYFMLPSGETHLFRISPATQEPVKASMKWHCESVTETLQ